MAKERYQRVEELFNNAADLSIEEQSAYLDEHCTDPEVRRRVEAMLLADRKTNPALDTPAMAGRFNDKQDGADEADNAPLPEKIGGHRIIRRIGIGGMGIVYEAEQDHPRRPVALKVMRPGLFSRQLVQRFEVEAHVLGQLHHPGIAQIYESGVEHTEAGEPQPYFVMEFITGMPLDDYVRFRKVSMRDRLELVRQVAEAVHHAHQKGVIHRDLKPDNILVDERGQPKVLDFGVARAVDSDVQVTTFQTDAGQLIGTLAYMSPEQIRGNPSELDTRSDVYTLGVILYELLGGKLPLDVRSQSIPEAIRMVLEEEPRRLSSINTRLRGDLDTIVRKAMEKDKDRRYSSAAELAADIQRYLKDEPILARRATTGYQLRKFAKRNKALVGGAAAVFLALVLGLVASTTLYLRAETNLSRALAAEEAAMQESAVATEVSNFLASLFEISDPGQARGREITAREMLDRGAARIRTELETGSAVRGRLLQVMGEVYQKLGAYQEARDLIIESHEIYTSLYEPTHPHVLESQRVRARLYILDGDLAEGRRLLQAGLNTMDAHGSGDPKLKWQYLNLFSALANREGNYAESRDLNLRSLRVLEDIEDDALRGELLPQTHHALGVSYYYLGNLDEARTFYQRGIEGFRALYGDEHPTTAYGLSSLGLTLRSLNRFEEAEQMLRESIRLGEILWGEESVNLTPALNNLALTLQSLERLDESEVIFRRLIDVYRVSYGERHGVTSLGIANLASLLTTTGRYDEAMELLEQAMDIRREFYGEGHHDVIQTWNLYLDWYRATERWPDAERMARQQHSYYFERDGEAAARTLLMLNYLAEAVRQQGRYDEALDLFEQELALRREHHGLAGSRTVDAVVAVAELHLLRGGDELAEALLREYHGRFIESGDSSGAHDFAIRADALYINHGRHADAANWRAMTEVDSDA